MSDDGAWALVVIALLGNPFSPRYAAARARGPCEPLDFAALNVALYGPGLARFCLVERPLGREDREADGVRLGRSTVVWSHDALVIDLDERTSTLPGPFAERVVGHVVLRPETLTPVVQELDGEGRHLWWPIAPRARVEAVFRDPYVRFAGAAYHDANAGDEPLDAGFDRWTWSRAHAAGGATRIAYDAWGTDGALRAVALEVDRSGAARSFDGLSLGPVGRGARTRWGLDRVARSDHGSGATLARGLEDTPFYARALIHARMRGEDVVAMHETLSLARLRQAWVRYLLGFRVAVA